MNIYEFILEIENTGDQFDIKALHHFDFMDWADFSNEMPARSPLTAKLNTVLYVLLGGVIVYMLLKVLRYSTHKSHKT